MTFGERLKTIRLEKDLTQKQLADLLNVTFQTVSKWENDVNEPSFSTLKDIAKALDCSVGYLFGEETKQITNIEDLPDDDYRKIIIYAYLGKFDDDEGHSLSFLKETKEAVIDLLILEAQEKGIFKDYHSFIEHCLNNKDYVSNVFAKPFKPVSPAIDDASNILNAYVAKKMIEVIVYTEQTKKEIIILNKLELWKSLIECMNKHDVNIRNLKGVNEYVNLVNERLYMETYIKINEIIDYEIRSFSESD